MYNGIKQIDISEDEVPGNQNSFFFHASTSGSCSFDFQSSACTGTLELPIATYYIIS